LQDGTDLYLSLIKTITSLQEASKQGQAIPFIASGWQQNHSACADRNKQRNPHRSAGGDCAS